MMDNMAYQLIFKVPGGNVRIVMCWIVYEDDTHYGVSYMARQVEDGGYGVFKQDVYKVEKSAVLDKQPLKVDTVDRDTLSGDSTTLH